MNVPSEIDAALAHLFDQLPLGVIVHRDGRNVYMNPTARARLGWTLADLPDSRTAFHRWYPDPAYRAQVRERWRAATRNPSSGDELVLKVRCASGEDRWLAFSPPVTLSEGAMVVTFLDVTRRIRAEESVTGFLANASVVGTHQLLVDPSGPAGARVISLSPEAARLFGVSPDAPADRWFDDIHPADVERIRAAHHRAAADVDVFDEMVRFGQPGTPIRHVHVRSVPVRRPDGQILFVGMALDQTDREQARADRARLLGRIEASRRADVVAAVSAEVGHDLRNLLTIGLTLLDDLEEQIPPVHPAAATVVGMAEVMERITILARQLQRAGQTAPLEHHEVDLGALAERTADLAGRSRVRRVDVRSTLARPTAITDPTRLGRALLNLVLNALDASGPDGTVTIEIDAAAGGGGVRLRVLDDGPGIPEDDLELVFAPFVTRREGGTGLGLPSTRRLVRDLGGDVILANRPTGGLAATIELPPSVAAAIA
jgi:PAS domain S-box-containing protein